MDWVKQRWVIVVVGVVAVLAVGIVGGTFVYIHFIEKKAPATTASEFDKLAKKSGSSVNSTTTSTTSNPQSDSTPSTSKTSGPTTAATATTVDGTWKPTSASEAGYRVKETLFGQSTTAAGRTNAVTGSFTIVGKSVTKGDFTVDLTKVSSDQGGRDNQFQTRIMDTATYPTATFKLTGPIALPKVPTAGEVVTATATGQLTMHGKTQSVTFPIRAFRSGATITAQGSIPITFSDYGIDNPSGGPAQVGSSGILEFLIVFDKS